MISLFLEKILQSSYFFSVQNPFSSLFANQHSRALQSLLHIAASGWRMRMWMWMCICASVPACLCLCLCLILVEAHYPYGI